MIDLTSENWNQRYESGETGWDLGEVSPPLKNYFDQLEDKNIRILIPGAGNAYEAAYLYQNGFKNVFILDWATYPLTKFKERYPDFPDSQCICSDFFEHQAQYNLIIEQTFFCALLPKFRKMYFQKTYQLLKPGGKLMGLLFQIPLNTDQPPFGGDKETYLSYIPQGFRHVYFETASNSHHKRAGNELFMLLKKENK